MHATVQDYSPLPFIAYFWVHLDCFFMSPLVCRLSSVKGMYGSGVYFAQKARVPRSLHREVKWCRIAVINRCHPWSFLALFFFSKRICENPHWWTWGMASWMDRIVFFPWGLQSGSIRGTVPQFCEASPPGEFLGEKRRVRNSCGFILNLLYIFLETNIALWNRSWKTASFFCKVQPGVMLLWEVLSMLECQLESCTSY